MMDSRQEIVPTLVILSVALIAVLVGFIFRSKAQGKLTKSLEARIHELKHLQQADKILIEELERQRQQLFGVVTHHVRGPFNRIFALVHLIQISSGNLQPEQLEYLKKIHLMIADGLGMIRNLSDMQKLEGNGVDLNFDNFNLSTLLSVLARNYKALAEKKNIKLQDDIAPALMVFSDRYYSNRILDNLVSNAIKFSGENKTVFIAAIEEGEWVSVEVKDEGPGISEEDQQKLYKKFQTLSAKPTAGETSNGIGLSVAKQLAEKTGAKLTCRSIVGHGASFTLKIRKEKTE
jgi:signal transduction histidine kinase